MTTVCHVFIIAGKRNSVFGDFLLLQVSGQVTAKKIQKYRTFDRRRPLYIVKGGLRVPVNKNTVIEEQYDKIYRYCYFKVHQRELAEDITQEAFLRFWESSGYVNTGQALQYLYTIARHLCIDEYRKRKEELLKGEEADNYEEEKMVTGVAVRIALAELDTEDRELLLLRYVNEVPVSVLSRLYEISRFAVYRRILRAVKNFKEKLGREGFT